MNEFNYDDSAYLAHHGIKGMKWGVRKDKSSYRTSDAIKSRIKKASFSRGNENYVRLGRNLELATNAPARKAMRKRHAKGMAIAAGLGAGALGAAAIAGGISAANKKKNGYGSYREIDENYRLPNNNYDQYSPYNNSHNGNPNYDYYKKQKFNYPAVR